MYKQQSYTETDLISLFTNLDKFGITDDMARELIKHCFNYPPNLRSSGFYFPGGIDSIFNWDAATRTLTLSPLVPEVEVYDAKGNLYKPHIKFYSWYQGPVLHRKFEPVSIQVPAEEGRFLIHFTVDYQENDFLLAYLKNPTPEEISQIYMTGVPVGWVYWNAVSNSAIYVGDSRHGSQFNPQIHWVWHQTFNSVRQEGIGLTDGHFDGDGSENAHYQFGISAGKLWHEDIPASVEAIAPGQSIPVWYFEGELPRFQLPSNKKFLNAGRVAFNSNGINQAQNYYYVLYHLFAANCQLHPVISVMGRQQFEELGQAVATINAEMATLKHDLPHSNLMWIDTVIIQTSDDYTNAAKARIVTNACTVMTEMSAVGDGSPTNKIKLFNDEENPADLHFYGTGDAFEPAKGFHHLYAKLVNQPTHGFSEKQAIRHNGTAFVLAKADTAENAQTTGIVVEVIDVDHFRYQSGGFYAHENWVAGTEYFLSPVTAGLVTTEYTWTYPDDAGKVRQHLGYGTDRGLKIEIDVGDEIGGDSAGVSTEKHVVGTGKPDDKVRLFGDVERPITTPNKYYGTKNGSDETFHSLPEEAVQALSSPSDTFDMKYGRGATITLTADTTIIFANLKANDNGHIEVKQDATGGHRLIFAGVTIEISEYSFEAQNEVSLTGVAGSNDVVAWWWTGSVMKLAVIYNFLSV